MQLSSTLLYKHNFPITSSNKRSNKSDDLTFIQNKFTINLFSKTNTASYNISISNVNFVDWFFEEIMYFFLALTLAIFRKRRFLVANQTQHLYWHIQQNILLPIIAKITLKFYKCYSLRLLTLVFALNIFSKIV